MLYLTCTTITSVDLAHYGVTRAKDLLSVDCGTIGGRSRRLGIRLQSHQGYKRMIMRGCVH